MNPMDIEFDATKQLVKPRPAIKTGRCANGYQRDRGRVPLLWRCRTSLIVRYHLVLSSKVTGRFAIAGTRSEHGFSLAICCNTVKRMACETSRSRVRHPDADAAAS
jgi:hypothetical protein